MESRVHGMKGWEPKEKKGPKKNTEMVVVITDAFECSSDFIIDGMGPPLRVRPSGQNTMANGHPPDRPQGKKEGMVKVSYD